MGELSRAHDVFDREIEISRQVTETALEEIDITTLEAPTTARPLSIAKDLKPAKRVAMINLLREYKDMFVWSHKDMKRLNPKFYKHQINLATDVKPI